MAHNDRHDEILKILGKLKKVSVQTLTERLKVSEVTIRKDLTLLEEKGRLVRIHGGAILAEDSERLRTLSMRIHENVAEKKAIAAKARELIREEDSIYIDAGSTCSFLAKEIRNMSLRVVTNSIDVLVELSDSPGINLTSLGGSFRHDSGSFIGPAALKSLKMFQIDTCFLGTTGISGEAVFSSQNTIEAELKRSIIESSKRAIVLADHTKYGITAFSIFAKGQDIDILICNGGVEHELLSPIKARGVEVIFAPLV